jgi:hypothetical protein
LVFLFKKYGLIIMHKAGMSSNAQSRHNKIELIIRKANERISGKDEMKRIENPAITDRALIVIPLPVLVILVITALS